MRTPRYWSNLVILPEADVAIGPLPVPGVGVTVQSGRAVDVHGDGFTFRFRTLGFKDLDHAMGWLGAELERLGFDDVRWASPEGSRLVVARRDSGATTGRTAWITRAEGDGPITLVEEIEAEIGAQIDDLAALAKPLVGVAEMWLRAFEHPDDALAHSVMISNELDLSFRLPAGMVPTDVAYGMTQADRVGRHGAARFVADGIMAEIGPDAEKHARELADDPGVHDARVRMVDEHVAEVRGQLRDDMGQEAELRCRVIPAEEGVGLAICALTLAHEEDDEAKKLVARASETVAASGDDPKPVPDDLPGSLSEVLTVADSFRRRLDADGRRVS